MEQAPGTASWKRISALGLWPKEINWLSHVLRKEEKNPFLLPFKFLSPAFGFNFVLSGCVGALSSSGGSQSALVMEKMLSRRTQAPGLVQVARVSVGAQDVPAWQERGKFAGAGHGESHSGETQG